MGAWGVGLYSDDLAADLRGDLREYFGDGLSAVEAVDRLMAEYASSVDDPDEGPVFWLAIADTGWKLGRLDDRARHRALEIIDNGQDLSRWPDAPDRRKRETVLAKLRAQLFARPPAAKRIPKVIKAANDWTTGEILALRLASGLRTLIRVIGHHVDKGGRSAVCELLDWTGSEIPSAAEISRLNIRHRIGSGPYGKPQFFLQEARKKKDKARLERTGIVSTPAQEPGGYLVVIWSHLDYQLADQFGLAT